MSALAEDTARNRAAAEAMYGAAKTGDPGTFFSYIDPEIVVEEPTFLPYGGRYDGIEGLQQLFGILATTFDLTSLDFERITADGDLVCAIGRVRLADGSGTVAFIERCQMRDGKAVHLRIYIHDPSTLLTTAAGSGAAMAQPPTGITHIERPPGRALAVINHVPTLIFQLHASRLFGERFAMITHRGRKSGQPRTVIVETAAGSVAERRLVYIVAYGKRAQWYRNLKAAPAISIEIAGKIYHQPRHEFLDAEGTAAAIASYWQRYPRLASLLARNGVFFYPGPVADHPLAPLAIAFSLE